MYPACKRLLDILLSAFSAVVLFPVMLLIALAIRLDSPGPVFFRQKRFGRCGKAFEILKFRTMRIDTPKYMPTHMLENPDYWITRVGHVLRKTSLDELPQIYNILIGQMSVVGPRPALLNQVDLIEARAKHVGKRGKTPNDLRPGLTGWAQINGRDELPIPGKAALDGEYAKRIGFFFDLRCVFGTFSAVARGAGVVEGGTGALEKQPQAAVVDSEGVKLRGNKPGDGEAEARS